VKTYTCVQSSLQHCKCVDEERKRTLICLRLTRDGHVYDFLASTFSKGLMHIFLVSASASCLMLTENIADAAMFLFIWEMRRSYLVKTTMISAGKRWSQQVQLFINAEPNKYFGSLVVKASQSQSRASNLGLWCFETVPMISQSCSWVHIHEVQYHMACTLSLIFGIALWPLMTISSLLSSLGSKPWLL